MASNSLCHLFILILSFFFLSPSHAATPSPLIFPIRKDDPTRLYYTTIMVGTPPTAVNTLLDLAGQWSWFNCDGGYNSLAYRPVACGSDTCNAAGGIGCVGCNGPARPGCTNDTCGVFPYNPFQNMQLAEGLGEDVLVVRATDGLKYTSRLHVRQFPVACVSSSALEGLPNTTTGVIALSRAMTSLPSKLWSALNLSSKVALCLPSSSKLGHGDMYIGGGPYYRPFTGSKDFSKSLLVTKLLVNPVSTAPISSEGDASFEYFVDVRAIKVDYTPVSFNNSLLDIGSNGVGGTKISTITPYTKLHSSIYKTLMKAFAEAASKKKIKKTANVAPFGLCYKMKTIGSTKAGPDVPNIVLVLQSDAQWEIKGANSMVRVSKEVMCLGFVDAGKEVTTSIVIGAHQMEENLLEFDVNSSTFAFSNSLLLQNTSCSHF
ncbi:probable aspartic proteinase GIP2 [Punica granatum]|uniref:Peptidase A1 domain-containing protein n=2 Tax=Punica granatum TaxID=22663 RepID=A0A218WPB6_PUNGR|nr:probable aspartic proteinase GIP2 [Punica granatum]OWM74210.1 hypothetical protein CDL15_Pgr008523 [Punica granatum]PKI77158.1 hypothetical protein CRG98_002440 [Punica granatum]